MKKIYFLINVICVLVICNDVKSDTNISLKNYLNNKNTHESKVQIYLLNRCSAVYAFASAVLIKTDQTNSKKFIEIASNLLFKSVELMVIDEDKKFEEAREDLEIKRKVFFENYLTDGKINWEKNKSYFKGSYISEDISICSKLVEEK